MGESVTCARGKPFSPGDQEEDSRRNDKKTPLTLASMMGLISEAKDVMIAFSSGNSEQICRDGLLMLLGDGATRLSRPKK